MEELCTENSYINTNPFMSEWICFRFQEIPASPHVKLLPLVRFLTVITKLYYPKQEHFNGYLTNFLAGFVQKF